MIALDESALSAPSCVATWLLCTRYWLGPWALWCPLLRSSAAAVSSAGALGLVLAHQGVSCQAPVPPPMPEPAPRVSGVFDLHAQWLPSRASHKVTLSLSTENCDHWSQ